MPASNARARQSRRVRRRQRLGGMARERATDWRATPGPPRAARCSCALPADHTCMSPPAESAIGTRAGVAETESAQRQAAVEATIDRENRHRANAPPDHRRPSSRPTCVRTIALRRTHHPIDSKDHRREWKNRRAKPKSRPGICLFLLLLGGKLARLHGISVTRHTNPLYSISRAYSASRISRPPASST